MKTKPLLDHLSQILGLVVLASALALGSAASAVAAPILAPRDRDFLETETLAGRAELVFAETAIRQGVDARIPELALATQREFQDLDRQFEALNQRFALVAPGRQRWQARHDAEELARLPPWAFDRYYVNLVAEDLLISVRHERRASRKTADPEIRAFALAALPALEKLLDRAQHLVPYFGQGRTYGGDSQ